MSLLFWIAVAILISSVLLGIIAYVIDQLDPCSHDAPTGPQAWMMIIAVILLGIDGILWIVTFVRWLVRSLL